MSLLGFAPIAGFVTRNWDVLLFYSIIALLIYVYRKKFVFQGIVALLRTQLGVRWMTTTGSKYPRLWYWFGIVAAVIGFIGMAGLLVYFVYGLYALVAIPDAPPTLSPVIPGVKIPGVPFVFPLWYTLAALFFSVIVHEACHGLLSAASGVKIKASGFAMIGPIPGAFVEPDEKQLAKRPIGEQLGMIAVGPFSNVVLAFVALGVFIGLAFVGSSLVTAEGISIGAVVSGAPAATAGVPVNATITAINGVETMTVPDLQRELGKKKPGDSVFVTASGTQYAVTLGESPDDARRGYLGVQELTQETAPKNPSMAWLIAVIRVLIEMAKWVWIISLGIGIANLIPIGPIDGGRMAYLALNHYLPKERAEKIFSRWSMGLLAIVLILVIVPIVRAIF